MDAFEQKPIAGRMIRANDDAAYENALAMPRVNARLASRFPVEVARVSH
jgi:hypothetical protein